MRQLFIWLERIITRHKALKRWKRIVTVLAAIMTFATTYALILPAITVEKNGAGEVGGMFLEQTESLDDMLEENAIEPSEGDILAGIADEDGTVETDAPTALSTLKASGSDYTVNLFYDATSGIPEGAALAVSEITQDAEEYPNYLEETKKAMGLAQEETLPYFAARFFDIKIMVGDEEFTPETGVFVEISYEEPLAERANAEVSAVHFANETSEPNVIEANTTEVQNGGAATVEFAAESFSVYGVIYTVDFSWEVNGNMYEVSIPGGGFVSFECLVEELGLGASAAVESEDAEMIVEDAESIEDAQVPEERNAEFDYVSEATSKFTAGVRSVEFSMASH